jgi:hypothetical protein
VDGVVVGDLGKDEFLAVALEAGAHSVTIDPVPEYRFAGEEGDAFVRDLRNRRVRAMLQVHGDPEAAVYVETYLCTGTGTIAMHAAVRDAPSGLKALTGLQPAW